MSDEEDIANDATSPASPSWMQSQQPKPLLKSEDRQTPKPRKPRRTRAQIAEAKAASVTITRTDGNSGPLPIAGVVVAVDDDTVRLAPHIAFPKLSWWNRNRQDLSLALLLASFAVSLLAFAIALVR